MRACLGTLWELSPKYKHMNLLLQRTKQYQRKVLLSSFHLNGNTTDSIVRATLYSVINSITGKYCSVAFMRVVTLYDFIHRLKS